MKPVFGQKIPYIPEGSVFSKAPLLLLRQPRPENPLGEYEIGLPGGAQVGISVADVDDLPVARLTGLEDVALAGPALVAGLIGVGKFDGEGLSVLEGHHVGIEGDVGEAVSAENKIDIEIQAVGNDLHIDAVLPTEGIELPEMGVDDGVFGHELQHVLPGPAQDGTDAAIGLLRNRSRRSSRPGRCHPSPDC